MYVLQDQKKKINVTHCISGPQWVPQSFFDLRYVPLLDAALLDEHALFFVGDAAKGVDAYAQQFFIAKNIEHKLTVVLKKGAVPTKRAQNFKIIELGKDYPERDILMARLATAPRPIVVLPQFGGGTGGAIVPILAKFAQSLELDGCVLPADFARTLAGLLRNHSEPPDPELESVMSQLQHQRCTVASK